jgi:hypothetical protein
MPEDSMKSQATAIAARLIEAGRILQEGSKGSFDRLKASLLGVGEITDDTSKEIEFLLKHKP